MISTFLFLVGCAVARREPSSLLQLRVPIFNNETDRLVIFTRPKTASSTLQTSLSPLLGNYPEWIGEEMDTYPRHLKIHNDTVAQDFFEKAFKEATQGSTIWIVRSIRFIGDREISQYFQLLCEEHCLNCAVCSRHLNDPHVEQVPNESDVEEVRGDYLKWMEELPRGTATDVTGDFERVVGVRGLTPSQFDSEKGRLLLESSVEGVKVNTVVVRFEDIARWPEILAPIFHGYEEGERNLSEFKWYAGIFDEVKKTLADFESKFPAEYGDVELNQELQFYSPSERQSLSEHLMGKS